MTRREFVEVALAFAGAALLGAVGGLTDGHVNDETEDDEPPSEGSKS